MAPVSIDTEPIEQMLKTCDHQSYTLMRAHSIAAVKTSLEKHIPQLILAYAEMGEASLLVFIKELTTVSEVPIVILAPSEFTIDDSACLEAGAHGFIILEQISPVRFERHLRFIISNANAQIRLKQMLETRDHFLSLLAHDLRGPLGILYSGFKHYHERFHETDPERIERFLFNGKNQAQDILALTQRILSWVSAQDEHVVTHLKVIDLYENTRDNLKPYGQALLEKELQVKIDIDPAIQIIADPDMWDTIVRNFFYNAIKFSLPGHTIRFKGANDPKTDTICFMIEDEGVGMTPRQIKQLLDSSGPVDTRRGTQNERGHGLGIQICTQYIRLLDGTLRIHSEIESGTQIEICIPQAP